MKRFLYIILLQASVLVCFAQNHAIRYWEYDINGERGIPCRFDAQSNKLFLSGFDVSAIDGMFYFAGGKPLTVACFNGDAKVFAKQIDREPSTIALFRQINDTVYIINNQSLAFYKMHKNGTGEVKKREITLEGFKLLCGTINESEIVLVQNRETIVVNSSAFVFPGFDAIHFDLNGTFKKWHWFGRNDRPMGSDMNLKAIVDDYLYSSKRLNDDTFTGFYKGQWKGFSVFWGNCYSEGNASWTVALADENGNVKKRYDIDYNIDNMYSVIPMPVLTDEIDAETFSTSPNYCILRGGYLYMVGYSGEKRKIIVCSINLTEAFRN